MPISRQVFEQGDFPTRAGQVKQKVLEFLNSHRGYAYTVKEIAEQSNIQKGAIGGHLKGLFDNHLVEWKSPYWMAKR